MLCSALLHSYPPWCGGPSPTIEGLDLASLLWLVFDHDPTLAQVTWSEHEVEVRGTLDGVLTAA
jgi:hypothetical protein